MLKSYINRQLENSNNHSQIDYDFRKNFWKKYSKIYKLIYSFLFMVFIGISMYNNHYLSILNLTIVLVVYLLFIGPKKKKYKEDETLIQCERDWIYKFNFSTLIYFQTLNIMFLLEDSHSHSRSVALAISIPIIAFFIYELLTFAFRPLQCLFNAKSDDVAINSLLNSTRSINSSLVKTTSAEEAKINIIIENFKKDLGLYNRIIRTINFGYPMGSGALIVQIQGQLQSKPDDIDLYYMDLTKLDKLCDSVRDIEAKYNMSIDLLINCDEELSLQTIADKMTTHIKKLDEIVKTQISHDLEKNFK